MLLAFFLKRHSATGVCCSAALAHQYVSKFARPKHAGTIREPLAVLVKIGVLKIVQSAVNGLHVKTSARYCLHENYASRPRRTVKVVLTPKLAQKREQAYERREKRLLKPQPFRARLLNDLQKLEFSDEGKKLLKGLMGNPDLKPSLASVAHAVDSKTHTVSKSPRGQIATSITSCSRLVKPHLLLDGERTVSCDISHAHHCFLPRILADRIEYFREQHGDFAKTERHELERGRLIDFLSDGDYYREWCVNPDDDAERAEKKLLVNMILNWPNAKCATNRLYRRIYRTFPITFSIVEDIKRADHRNISKQTQHYTAKAINAALLEVQGMVFPT